jgi:hypothetical protein
MNKDLERKLAHALTLSISFFIELDFKFFNSDVSQSPGTFSGPEVDNLHTNFPALLEISKTFSFRLNFKELLVPEPITTMGMTQLLRIEDRKK